MLSAIFLTAALLGLGDPNASGAAAPRAGSPAPEAQLRVSAWLPGGTPAGLAGVHRVMAGHAGVRPGLTFALEGGFSHASDFLLPGDAISETMFNGAIAWSGNPYFELGLSGFGKYVTDSGFAGASALEIFPAFNAKANLSIFEGWGTAAAFGLVIPSVSGVHGALSPGDSAFTFTAIGSRMLVPWLELTGNLGFVLDRVRYAATDAINPAQRYASSVVRTNRITVGAAASTLLPNTWLGASFGPYLEVTGEIAPGAAFKDNPWRVTLGSKVFVDADHTIEADIGVDVRLLGAPRFPDSPYPGTPPWGIFAAVSYHSPLLALQSGGPVWVINGNQTKPVTVTIRGRIQDTNAQVLADASIVVDDGNRAYITVDPNTGHYETLPILATDGNVTIECSAPGYVPQRRVLSVRSSDTALEVNFHLDPKELTATLRGFVYDAKTGKGIAKAKVFVSGRAEGAYSTDAQGNFVVPMRAGRYEVIVAAPGYVTHRYPTDIPDNTEIVIHAGLQRKRHGRRAAPGADGAGPQ